MLNNFADFSFTETAFSGYQSRTIVDRGQNTVKSIDRIYAELAAKGLGTNKLDNCFRGLHRFENGIIAHVDQVKPINDWPGKYLSDFIPLDLDNSEAAHLAVPDFRGMIEALYVKGLKIEESERYSICLTGSKGFVLMLHAGAIGFEPERNFAKIALRFCELLLPDQVGKKKWVDDSNFQASRLWRIIGSFNAPKNAEEAEKTKEKIRGYKVELVWQEVLDLVQKDHKLVYELWRSPNVSGIDETTVSGSRYWNCEPVPFLQSLWQQAKETYRGEKRMQVQGASFSPLQAQSKFARHPACVAKLLQIIESGDVDNELAGTRHQAFLGLATYCANGMGLGVSSAAYEVFMRELHNKLSEAKRLPEAEFVQVLRDGLKYHFSCGNRDSGTSLIKFCSGSCLQKALDPKRRWRDLIELLPEVTEFFSGIVTPFRYGVKRIDDFVGGFMKKSINVMIADPGTGKTMLGLQSLVQMAKIAKEHGFCVPFLSPEETLAGLGANLAMQLERKTHREIFKDFADNGIPSFRAFCEEFNGYVKLIDIRSLNTAEIKKNILDVQQACGRPASVVYLDNITFLGMAKAHLAAGINYAQEIAVEINQMIDEIGCVFFGSIHMPKAGTDRKIRKAFKDGGEYLESKPKAESAFGTQFWWALSSSQYGLYNRGPYMMISFSKCRKRINGERYLPKPVPMFVSNHYAVYDYDRLSKMEDALQRFPHLDLNEMQALNEGIDPLEEDSDKPKRKPRNSTLNYVEE